MNEQNEQELVLVEVQDVEYDMACRNGCQGSSGSPTGG